MSIRRRLFEIGIATRITHNYAKYKAGLSNAYNAEVFLVECRSLMEKKGIAREQIDRIFDGIEERAKEEMIVYTSTGRFSTDGASEVSVEILLEDSLDDLKQIG